MGKGYDVSLMIVRESRLIDGTDLVAEKYSYSGGEDRIRIVQKFTSTQGEKLNVICRGLAPAQWTKIVPILEKMMAPEAPAVVEKPKPQPRHKVKRMKAA